MRKLVGLHTGDFWFNHLDIIKRWQPPVITILNPNKEQTKELRKVCPNTILVGRIYVEDGWANNYLKTDPSGFAQHTHNAIINANIPEIDYWVMSNEPTPYWDWLPNIDTYSYELMKLADVHGYKVGIFSISVGNFDLPKDNPMAYWQQLTRSLTYAQEHDHVVLVHQYQKPNLINNNEDDDWLIFRLEKKVLPGLKQMGYGKLKFIISEMGVDHLINSGSVGGFQSTPLSDQQYFDQLLQWQTIEQEYTDNILGGCIFMFGSQNPWQTYSITHNSNVANMLANYFADNKGDEADMAKKKVNIPLVKNEPVNKVEWDERLTKRGIILTPPKGLKNGDKYWQCIKGEYLEEKEHIFVNTLDENGNPKVGVSVKFYWADDSTSRKTKDISNDKYAYGMVDFDMHAHGNSYGTIVLEDLPSDDIWGMGLGSVEQPDWNIHVSYRFTFRVATYKQTVVETPMPEPVPEPVQSDFIPFKGKVLATILNVRSGPGMSYPVVNKLANGASVNVLEHDTKDGWYKIGVDQWVSDNYVGLYSTEDGLIDELLEQFARLYKIDEDVVKATFTIESGSVPFGVNGKPIIRFENHIFFRELNNPDLYYKYFTHNSNTDSHRWRLDENSEWIAFHGNQQLEWKVFEFAKTLSETAATRSISMGMPQIMGFNFDDVGYISPTHMLNAFSQPGTEGIVAQVFAFFAFCQSQQFLMNHLRNKNWVEFALIYNGAESYAALLEAQYNKLKVGK